MPSAEGLRLSFDRYQRRQRNGDDPNRGESSARPEDIQGTPAWPTIRLMFSEFMNDGRYTEPVKAE